MHKMQRNESSYVHQVMYFFIIYLTYRIAFPAFRYRLLLKEKKSLMKITGFSFTIEFYVTKFKLCKKAKKKRNFGQLRKQYRHVVISSFPNTFEKVFQRVTVNHTSISIHISQKQHFLNWRQLEKLIFKYISLKPERSINKHKR